MSNDNTDGSNPLGQLYGNIMFRMLTNGTPLNSFFNEQMSASLLNSMSNNRNLFGEWAVSGLNFLGQYSNLQNENTNLKTKIEKLKKDNASLEQKYQIACLSSRKTLEKIEEQKRTIEELKQKLNVPSPQSKMPAQNGKNSIDQSNRPSLLRKIQSFKDLKPCKTVDYSYNGNNKGQQTK